MQIKKIRQYKFHIIRRCCLNLCNNVSAITLSAFVIPLPCVEAADININTHVSITSPEELGVGRGETVTIQPAGRLTLNYREGAFSGNITGSGVVRVEANRALFKFSSANDEGRPYTYDITLSGDNSGFTGELVIAGYYNQIYDYNFMNRRRVVAKGAKSLGSGIITFERASSYSTICKICTTNYMNFYSSLRLVADTETEGEVFELRSELRGGSTMTKFPLKDGPLYRDLINPGRLEFSGRTFLLSKAQPKYLGNAELVNVAGGTEVIVTNTQAFGDSGTLYTGDIANTVIFRELQTGIFKKVLANNGAIKIEKSRFTFDGALTKDYTGTIFVDSNSVLDVEKGDLNSNVVVASGGFVIKKNAAKVLNIINTKGGAFQGDLRIDEGVVNLNYRKGEFSGNVSGSGVLRVEANRAVFGFAYFDEGSGNTFDVTLSGDNSRFNGELVIAGHYEQSSEAGRKFVNRRRVIAKGSKSLGTGIITFAKSSALTSANFGPGWKQDSDLDVYSSLRLVADDELFALRSELRGGSTKTMLDGNVSDIKGGLLYNQGRLEFEGRTFLLNKAQTGYHGHAELINVAGGTDVVATNAQAFGDDGTLYTGNSLNSVTFRGLTDGIFKKTLSGAGTIKVEDSLLTFAGGFNKDYTGVISISNTGTQTTVTLSGESRRTGMTRIAGYSGKAGVLTQSRVELNHINGLGSGAIILDDGGVLQITAAAAGDVVFNNELLGNGRLEIDLASGDDAFSFGRTSTEFTGTAALGFGRFVLNDANMAALSRAKLEVGNGNVTTIGEKERIIGGLVLNGGSLAFDTMIPGDREIKGNINAGSLEIASGGGSIVVKSWTPYAEAKVPSQNNILAHDQSTGGLQLIKSGIPVQGGTGRLQLVDGKGTILVDKNSDGKAGKIHDIQDLQTGEVVAKGHYDYGFSTGENNDGLYVDYILKEVDIQADKILVLRPDQGVRGGHVKLDARLTGSGHVVVDASTAAEGVVSLTNSGNDYTGETTISGGQLRMEDNHVLGRTSHLTIQEGTGLDVNGKTQTLRGLSAAGDNALFGGGVLILTKDAASGSSNFILGGQNEYLGADVRIEQGAQATLNHVSGLGTGGKVTLLDHSGLIFSSAKGTLNKGIYGESGTVSLTGDADLQLADIGRFDGQWRVEQTSQLTATRENQLGAGVINLDMDATLRIKSDRHWTFENTIVTADASDDPVADVVRQVQKVNYGHFIKDGGGQLKVGDRLAAFKGDVAIDDGVLIIEGFSESGQALDAEKGGISVAKGAVLSGYGVVNGRVVNNGMVTSWNALRHLQNDAQADDETQQPYEKSGLHFNNGLENNGILRLAGIGNTDVGNTMTIAGGLIAGEGSRLVVNISAVDSLPDMSAGNIAVIDDYALKDMLILDGGVTIGKTLVTVLVREYVPENTRDGIQLVRLINNAVASSDAFVIDRDAVNFRKATNTLRIGVYDYGYSLVRKEDEQGGDGWWLYLGGSAGKGAADGSSGTGGTSGTGRTVGTGGVGRFVSPEFAVVSGMQSANRSMFMLELRDHEGRQFAVSRGRDSQRVWSVWSRFEGGYNRSDYDGGTRLRYNSYMTQLGIDLAGADLGRHGAFYAGVMGGWGYDKFNANYKAASASGHSNGYAGGVYATWYSNDREQDQGGYIDSWLQYGYYDNQAKDTGSFKADSLLGSVETGYKIGLFEDSFVSLWLLPQGQVSYVSYDRHSFKKGNRLLGGLGTKVGFEDNDGFMTRVGVRFGAALRRDNGVILRPYSAFDWNYNQKLGTVSYGFEHLSGSLPRNTGSVRLGFEADINSSIQLWGQGSASFGGNSYQAYKGSLGVRIKW